MWFRMNNKYRDYSLTDWFSNNCSMTGGVFRFKLYDQILNFQENFQLTGELNVKF